MKRVLQVPRNNWQEIVKKQGLIWHTHEGEKGDGESNIFLNPTIPSSLYWDESVCYEFSLPQVNKIEKATEECYQMLLELGDCVLNKGTTPRFIKKLLGDDSIDMLSLWGIPNKVHSFIRDTWEAEPPSLNYGRFDFAWDGTNEPKMLEFNCDTPTSLLEASLIQWYWKEDVRPEADQYNSIHESLISKFQDIKAHLPFNMLHFTSFVDDTGEDQITVAYLRDCAEKAGIDTHHMPINEIGWNNIIKSFVDNNDNTIHSIYKLYPWEWLVHESFSDNLIKNNTSTNWIEPIWKMLWSNKFILYVLHNMFPDSPYLLKADIKPLVGKDYIKKPILSREGANIEIVSAFDEKIMAASEGSYGKEGFIYQELYRLPGEYNQNPVIGAWIVDGYPCGMGIREGGLITDNKSRFVPHVIVK